MKYIYSTQHCFSISALEVLFLFSLQVTTVINVTTVITVISFYIHYLYLLFLNTRTLLALGLLLLLLLFQSRHARFECLGVLGPKLLNVCLAHYCRKLGLLLLVAVSVSGSKQQRRRVGVLCTDSVAFNV